MFITIDKSIKELHNIFEPYFAVQYLNSENISKEILKNSSALIIRSTRKYGEETLLGTGVKFIGTVTSGYEHIDTEFCEKNGVFWATAHGSNAESVAEYVSAALIEISKKTRPLNELALGIVGVGATGSAVKEKAGNFGMQLLLCDPPKKLNDNIFDADIITLHVPLEKNGEYPTWHMVNENFFQKMKKGTWLINAARGAVCDSEALRQALQSKHLAGAVIDVWENEPDIDESLLPLIEIATPHIAGHNTEAKINAANMLINALGKYFNIKELESKTLPFPANLNKGPYSIHKDNAEFRKNPKNFTKIRNEYGRSFVSSLCASLKNSTF
ncbi:MAG: 4-phosphoerythronate dehydrogenase [Fibromonadaceae bacterium]|jgi:erythronate-4-phosphate dehydrogenase|nr:4-phosphoerythronate dehydrogenase [Fibromonadaceae bacterium]